MATSFWITNISKCDVMIADLGLLVPARRSLNLLDSKHYKFTAEQLKKSAENGSLKRKSHMIVVRKTEPEHYDLNKVYVKQEIKVATNFPSRVRFEVKQEEKTFQEFEILTSEDEKQQEQKYADEASEISEDRLVDYR